MYKANAWCAFSPEKEVCFDSLCESEEEFQEWIDQAKDRAIKDSKFVEIRTSFEGKAVAWCAKNEKNELMVESIHERHSDVKYWLESSYGPISDLKEQGMEIVPINIVTPE